MPATLLKCHALAVEIEPLTDPGESQLPLHCGMAAVLDLHPMFLPLAAVRPITVFRDQPFQSHAAGRPETLRPDLAALE
jgi:hypothetical protein